MSSGVATAAATHATAALLLVMCDPNATPPGMNDESAATLMRALGNPSTRSAATAATMFPDASAAHRALSILVRYSNIVCGDGNDDSKACASAKDVAVGAGAADPDALERLLLVSEEDVAHAVAMWAVPKPPPPPQSPLPRPDTTAEATTDDTTTTNNNNNCGVATPTTPITVTFPTTAAQTQRSGGDHALASSVDAHVPPAPAAAAVHGDGLSAPQRRLSTLLQQLALCTACVLTAYKTRGTHTYMRYCMACLFPRAMRIVLNDCGGDGATPQGGEVNIADWPVTATAATASSSSTLPPLKQVFDFYHRCTITYELLLVQLFSALPATEISTPFGHLRSSASLLVAGLARLARFPGRLTHTALARQLGLQSHVYCTAAHQHHHHHGPCEGIGSNSSGGNGGGGGGRSSYGGADHWIQEPLSLQTGDHSSDPQPPAPAPSPPLLALATTQPPLLQPPRALGAYVAPVDEDGAIVGGELPRTHDDRCGDRADLVTVPPAPSADLLESPPRAVADNHRPAGGDRRRPLASLCGTVAADLIIAACEGLLGGRSRRHEHHSRHHHHHPYGGPHVAAFDNGHAADGADPYHHHHGHGGDDDGATLATMLEVAERWVRVAMRLLSPWGDVISAPRIPAPLPAAAAAAVGGGGGGGGGGGPAIDNGGSAGGNVAAATRASVLAQAALPLGGERQRGAVAAATAGGAAAMPPPPTTHRRTAAIAESLDAAATRARDWFATWGGVGRANLLMSCPAVMARLALLAAIVADSVVAGGAGLDDAPVIATTRGAGGADEATSSKSNSLLAPEYMDSVAVVVFETLWAGFEDRRPAGSQSPSASSSLLLARHHHHHQHHNHSNGSDNERHRSHQHHQHGRRQRDDSDGIGGARAEEAPKRLCEEVSRCGVATPLQLCVAIRELVSSILL